MCLAALALLAGCGSEASGVGSDAGSGGTAGGAGTSGAAGTTQGGLAASAGAGSGATANAGAATGEARGAVALHVTAGGNCSLADTWVDFPAFGAGHPVTAATHEALLENETRDDNGWTVQVVCEWLSVEDPYFVSLAIGLIDDADQRLVSMSPLLSVGAEQNGTITFRDSESTPLYAGAVDPHCQFEAISVDVPGGTVWGRVSCASVVDDDTGEECAVSEGYFYFENCTPKET
jgi:hypothetical protein